MPRSRKQLAQPATVWSDAPWISRRPADEKRKDENSRSFRDVQGQGNAVPAEASAPGRSAADLDSVQHSLSMLTFTQCTTGKLILSRGLNQVLCIRSCCVQRDVMLQNVQRFSVCADGSEFNGPCALVCQEDGSIAGYFFDSASHSSWVVSGQGAFFFILAAGVQCLQFLTVFEANFPCSATPSCGLPTRSRLEAVNCALAAFQVESEYMHFGGETWWRCLSAFSTRKVDLGDPPLADVQYS